MSASSPEARSFRGAGGCIGGGGGTSLGKKQLVGRDDIPSDGWVSSQERRFRPRQRDFHIKVPENRCQILRPPIEPFDIGGPPLEDGVLEIGLVVARDGGNTRPCHRTAQIGCQPGEA